MGILSRLFGGGGGGSGPGTPPVEHQGFTIHAEPMTEGSRHRICARIQKDGREHLMIRADTLESRDAAVEASVAKARSLIDQQGEGIFD